jgi:hypothetical protein
VAQKVVELLVLLFLPLLLLLPAVLLLHHLRHVSAEFQLSISL